MTWVCVNSFGTELIFETEPHKAVYSWRDDYGSCKCIEIPQGSIKKLIGRELSWDIIHIVYIAFMNEVKK